MKADFHEQKYVQTFSPSKQLQITLTRCFFHGSIDSYGFVCKLRPFKFTLDNMILEIHPAADFFESQALITKMVTLFGINLNLTFDNAVIIRNHMDVLREKTAILSLCKPDRISESKKDYFF